jgi:RimJ/RimL family protein N-acetyltransferase
MPLEGEHIFLREVQSADLPFLASLRNDLDTQAWPKTLPPDYTLEMLQQQHNSRQFSFTREDGRFIIVWKETGEAIGNISYTDLDPRWSATIGIMVTRAYWGTGAAYEAQEILLRFLFEELGLRVVRLWTNSGNPAAVRLAGRSGFQISGRGREAVFRRGRYYDSLAMDLLREEYYARHPEMVDGLEPLSTQESQQ